MTRPLHFALLGLLATSAWCWKAEEADMEEEAASPESSEERRERKPCYVSSGREYSHRFPSTQSSSS